MKPKHKEKLNNPAIRTLDISSFIFGISAALILYLESDYFKTAAHSDNVTVFFIAAYAITLVLIFNWHYLVRKFGKKKVFLADFLAKAIFLLVLAKLPVGKIGVCFLMGYMILTVLSWIDIDILLEACSRDHKTGRIRGAYLTIMNAGYLIAPFFAGLILNKYGFQPVFLVAAVLILVVWLICFFKLRNIDSSRIEGVDFMSLLRKLSGRKNVLRIYYVSFLLEFFYALMIIYTPLYLLELGFSWAQIGQIFTVMLLPFVLLQYPAGYLADKKFEERDMIIFSLFIMALSTFAIFFISSKNVLLWALVLFSTRIGASLIEILRDSYFYKRIDCRDVDIINFFRSVRPMAYIVGLAIATPVIYFLHIRFVFPLISIGVLTGILAAKNLASSRISPPARR
ncbi:MAG TPA: MFS transporter [Candidatus Bathyarchaeia archaeon]|nr:MFS transporter [Candidatus Bathyarchaeia archaeon]